MNHLGLSGRIVAPRIPLFVLLLAAFFGATLASKIVMAANMKCCKQQNNVAACSGCLGVDNSVPPDGTPDDCVNIGNHGAMKCQSGGSNDNCTEASLQCASGTNLTRYNVGIGCNCLIANGIQASATFFTDQCDSADSQCP